MINLLSEKEKKEIIFEKNRKVFLALIIFFLASSIFLFFLLFSFKIYFSSQIKTQNTIIVIKREEINLSSQFQEFKDIVQETNNKLKNIQDFYEKQILIMPIIKNISKFIPPSVYLTNLSIDRPTISEKDIDYLIDLSIQGYAETREDLFLFQKALKQSECFAGVDVSLRSWLEPENVIFYIDIKIK